SVLGPQGNAAAVKREREKHGQCHQRQNGQERLRRRELHEQSSCSRQYTPAAGSVGAFKAASPHFRFATHAPSERPSTRIRPLPESPSIHPLKNTLTGPGAPRRLSF